MDDVMDQFEDYLEGLRQRGGKLPSYSNHAKPRIKVISAASGIAGKHFVTPLLRRRLALAVREIGVEKPLQRIRKQKRDFDDNSALVHRYLTLLENVGQKLPEDPKASGEVFFAQIEIEAGLKHKTLLIQGNDTNKEHKTYLRQMITSKALLLGVESRILLQPLGQIVTPLTYELLMNQGTVERKHELEGKPNSAQQLYNTRSALNKFRNSHGVQLTDPIGKEFVIDYNRNVEAIIATITAHGSRKKFQAGIIWWQDFYQKLIKGIAIPSDLPQALSYLITASELRPSIVARLADVSHTALSQWACGTKTPSAVSLIALARLEALFNIPAGTLTNKVPCFRRSTRFRLSLLPEFLRKDRSLRCRVSTPSG